MTLSERAPIIIMSSAAMTIAMTPTMIKPILLTKEFFEKRIRVKAIYLEVMFGFQKISFISPDKAALCPDIVVTM